MGAYDPKGVLSAAVMVCMAAGTPPAVASVQWIVNMDFRTDLDRGYQ